VSERSRRDAFLRALSALVGHTPAWLVRLACRVGARLLVRLDHALVRTLRFNLQPLTGGDEAVVRAGVESYLRYVSEFVRFPSMSTDAVSRSVVVEGEHFLDEAISSYGSVVVLATHSGNWDFAGTWTAAYLGGLSAIASADISDEAVALYAARSIEVHAGVPGAFRAAKGNLAEGRSLLMLCDFAPSGARTVEVKLFDRCCELPETPFLLAAEAGRPVVPLRLTYVGGRTALTFAPPRHPDPHAPRAEAVQRLAQEVAEDLAVGLAENPQHWHAVHQRAWS
jgi:KDO2-lipid IV(A) lauroyltransferase